MFAKIQNNVVLKFPYTFVDLSSENPHTNFGNLNDLQLLYSKTEDAEKNNATIESVEVEATPSIDHATQKCVLSDFPLLKNNIWVLEYLILDKTQEEIDKYIQDKQDGTIE